MKPGRIQASNYHKVILRALNYIFADVLRNGVIERNVDKAKRIDILFDNPAKDRIFGI